MLLRHDMGAEAELQRVAAGGRLAVRHVDGRSRVSRLRQEGVAEMIHDVQVEATFPGGKLVTVQEPIR